ncbi:RagB/SusD family nutrient uptake outer membrane protein [Flavobacterium sp. SM2513]|uniref:RagB/SusD family nutrient uptake outer membrane protein n=1 Tax=Flavobacterium sp. SM2513 TaxID=3424766 RepID=UPI003D7F6336
MSCGDDFLEPVRNTSILTSVDIAGAADLNPDIVSGSLDGIGGYMIDPAGVTGTSHNDLGQKGVDIWLDMLSGDMALSANSYGWYQDVANLVSTVDFTRRDNRIIWTYYYKIVTSSNEVIGTLGGNEANPQAAETKAILAQAKAYRAYAYLYLAQIFQRGYDPAQPILPYSDGDEFIAEKVPASKVYDLVISDLKSSIILLEGYNRSFKHQIDKSVAQGLLAYAYGAIGDYPNAKIIADQIVDSGAYPLTTTGQLAFPGSGSGFNDVNTASWMWGYDLTADLNHQLIDWWGQMDYFTYSYAFAGDRKSIDTGLYAQIPSNDARKAQFGTSGVTALMPINKFFDPARVGGGQQIITTDLIFMRVEEFYLLSAEAAAKSGNEAAAKTRLKALLSSRLGGAANAAAYVDPLSGPSLINAIYLQTRIEMWGEGKSYLAMKRNQATITRGTNHVFKAGESFIYNSDEMSFQIPQSEMNNNPSITEQN